MGKQIRRIGDTWWIILSAAETKSRRPDERPIPEILTIYIDRWLECWRPLFLSPTDALWPSTKGGQLAYTYVGSIITGATLLELGVAISPHLFRDCAVYTIANAAGKRMGIASGLLQHADERSVEKAYNKGAAVEAVQKFQMILNELQNE